MDILPRSFYQRSSLEVAPDLLGLYLVHKLDSELLIGKIVEVEAYMGALDRAAHSFNNLRTPRNEVMYGESGHAYVYFIYGMYYCFNVVCAEINNPQAVLIRALEPLSGFRQMALNRYQKPFEILTPKEKKNLSNGPGKLCQAMKIIRENNGDDLTTSPIQIWTNNEAKPIIATSPRINIDYAKEAKDYPWRFYIKGNPYVSK